MLGIREIVQMLDDLVSMVASGHRPYLVLRSGETSADVRAASCTTEGLGPAQKKDYRYSLGDGRSLHEWAMPDGRRIFHIDQVDACTDAPGHIAADTHAVAGGVIGAVGGALVGGAVGSDSQATGKGVAIGTGLGAVVGGIVGALTPAQKRSEFSLSEALRVLGRA